MGNFWRIGRFETTIDTTNAVLLPLIRSLAQTYTNECYDIDSHEPVGNLVFGMKDFRKEGMGGDMNEMNFGDVGWGGWWRIYERIDTLLVYGMVWNGMDFFFLQWGREESKASRWMPNIEAMAMNER